MEKILLVEDEPNVRQTLADILLHHGFEVIQSENGKEGLRKLEDTLPDLIITDLMMPEMDGFEFIRQLKFGTKYSEIPILVLSAKSEMEDVHRSFELGVDDYILKPFTVDAVITSIRKMLDS